MMDIKEYYNRLFSKVESNKNSIFQYIENDEDHLFESAFNFYTDLETLYQVLGNRLESGIFKNAIRVYQESMLCAISGLYQPAFMGLRYFLERFMMGAYLSSSEIELRTWMSNERDTYWTELVGVESNTQDTNNNNPNRGIFSSKFTKAFFPDLDGERIQMLAMTKRVYRECSEYVHGNPLAIGGIPESLDYEEHILQEWLDKAETIKRCVLYVIFLRYAQSFSNSDFEVVKDIFLDEFRSVKRIKQYIESHE